MRGIFLALAILAVSCVKETAIQPEFYISEGKVPLTFPSRPTSYLRISFSTNCEWELEVPAAADSWLEASIKKGNPNGAMTKFFILLTATDNDSEERRSATLTIRWGEGQKTIVGVYQEGGKTGPEVLHKCSEFDISDDMLFSSCCSRTLTSVQQGFNYDPVDNTLYFTQLNRSYRILLSWTTPSVTLSTTVAPHWMGLRCFSHGNNTIIERTSNGEKYVWSPNYGTRDSEGKYSNPWIVSRFPLKECFSDSNDIYNTDPQENYYFGVKACWPAIDFDNDLIAICNYSSVMVYRLSTLMALPVTDITIPSSITYGGMSGTYDSGIPEFTGQPVVKAKDCSKVTPLKTFASTYSSRGLHWQTFCIANGKAYFLNQADVNEDGPITHDSYVEVYDLTSGKLLHSKVRQEYARNHKRLAELGFVESNYCYVEPEGIWVKGDAMYIMYTCRGNTSITTRRPVIFKLSADLD